MSQAHITWYGHSCFLIELAGGSIVLDPYTIGSVPGLRLPDLSADAVHASHNHSDHNGTDCVLTSGKPLPFTVREVTGTHDRSGNQGWKDNTILVIEGEGLRLVHLGDQGCVLTPEQVQKIGKPDLLMVPVGGFCTVGGREARQIAAQLEPTVIVPMHYRAENIGFDMTDTVDEFLQGELPVVYAQENQFIIEQGMEKQVLIPKLVQ